MDENVIEHAALKEILKRPYHRVIVPDEDGSFFAEISEFPGCFATGDSAVEALESLERVAEGWLGDAIAAGQDIPEPEFESEYSGKLVLRLPKSLHAHVAHAASRDGVSLNAYLCTGIAHYTGLSEASRTPTSVVNLMTGPNYVTATNVQQNLFVGSSANTATYSSLAHTPSLASAGSSGWRRIDG